MKVWKFLVHTVYDRDIHTKGILGKECRRRQQHHWLITTTTIDISFYVCHSRGHKVRPR